MNYGKRIKKLKPVTINSRSELFPDKDGSKTKFKNDAGQLQNLMKMVTGEMGSALTLMEQAKNEGAEDC